MFEGTVQGKVRGQWSPQSMLLLRMSKSQGSSHSVILDGLLKGQAIFTQVSIKIACRSWLLHGRIKVRARPEAHSSVG